MRVLLEHLLDRLRHALLRYWHVFFEIANLFIGPLLRRSSRGRLSTIRAARSSDKPSSGLEVDYFQGGEYEVTATVELQAGSGRIQRQAVCELQLRPEAGWTVRLAEGLYAAEE